MRKFFSSPLGWMLANLIGIALFLAAASVSWIEPELANVPGASGGDALVWFGTAVPILMFFLIGNPVWLIALMKGRRSRTAILLAFSALILMCWIVAFLFDNAHHGI